MWADGIPKSHSVQHLLFMFVSYRIFLQCCTAFLSITLDFFFFGNIVELYWKLFWLDIMCGLILGQTVFRYDLHSGINDTIGNHDDIATSIGYSDETGKLLSEPWSWNVWTLHIFQLLFYFAINLGKFQNFSRWFLVLNKSFFFSGFSKTYLCTCFLLYLRKTCYKGVALFMG